MREMLKIFKDICLLLLLLNGYILCEKPCAQVNSCKCEGVEKTIDLAALAIEAKDPPRFRDVTYNSSDVNVTYFYYNPCNSFKMGDAIDANDCQQLDVAICKYSNNSDANASFTNIGTQISSHFFFPKSSDPEIHYKNGASKTVLTLHCTPDTTTSTLQVDSVKGNTTFMTLSSPCSCFNGCGMPKSSNRLSAGSVLLILFFVGVMVYLLGGMLYQKFYTGATGLEIIPNFEFWIDFPFLVRDGVIFALNCCRTGRTYDSI